MHDLPPLSALRALEAVAIEKSISKAAIRLHVSHSAVSHQIKNLENWLNKPVIERHGPHIQLTSSGFQLAMTVTDAFNNIRRETELMAIKQASPVSIFSLSSVLNYWLVPKLNHLIHDLKQINPDISVHLSCDDYKLSHSKRSDISIKFHPTHIENGTLLFSAELIPVCTPNFYKEHGPFLKETDLITTNLIHDEDARMWKEWFKKVSLKVPEIKNQSLFLSDSNLILNAVLNHQGVGLCRRVFIEEYLKNGQLVQVFQQSLDQDKSYYLLHDSHLSYNAKLVLEWLKNEAQKLN